MIALMLAVTLAGTPAVNPQVVDTASYIQQISTTKVSDRRARHLARLIQYWSDYYHVEPKLIAAILRQESDFESGVKSCWNVIRHHAPAITCDYGIAQVNEVWIQTWKLDPVLLQDDDGYGIAVAARILSRLKKDYGDEPDWYGRYNSAVPSKKAVYLEQLGQFLAQE